MFTLFTVRLYFINRREMGEAALSDIISWGKLHRRNRHDRSVKLLSPLGKFSYDPSLYRVKTVLGKHFSFQFYISIQNSILLK